MIDETIRSRLYDEVEAKYPVRKGIESAKAKDSRNLLDKEDDLIIDWRRKTSDLREQLLAQLLFQLHTLFEMPVNDIEVKRLTREALERIFELEKTCRTDGPYDASSYASFLFRKEWHSVLDPSKEPPTADIPGADAGASTLLTGLHHVEQANFFQKSSQEIASWTKRFLQIERYHRRDAIEHETRLDRYRLLRSQLGKRPEPGWSFDDLTIWLEFRLLEPTPIHHRDVGSLSREIAHELSAVLPSELLAGAPIQPCLYVLLRCHQYCLAETVEPNEQRRLEELFATRQLDSILDCMRVVVNTTVSEHSIPETGTVLDRLQADGFNIEHQGFRDPYEAHLVALEDVERLETTRLPLFLPLAKLSGDFAQDMALNRGMLAEWHTTTVKEVMGECQAYATASEQPLPKAHQVAKLVRFATGWVLAGCPWLPDKQPEGIVEEARKVLPDSALRQLVRPRKGYELKSRSELGRMIELELRHQWEALARIARNQRIQGHHDYSQFLRYATFQVIREKSASDPLRAHELSANIDEIIQPQWVSAICAKWGLDLKQVQPHSVQSVEQHARQLVPPHGLVEQLARHFESTDGDLEEVYDSVVDKITPTFYKILVAYGRQKADLPRQPASREQIPEIVNLLTPPLETVQRIALSNLKRSFAQTGVPRYRERLPLYLTSTAEWKAYLAWQAHTRIGGDVKRFLDDGDLEGLLAELQAVAERVQLPPDTLSFESVQSTLTELIKPREDGAKISDSHIREIMQMLPQLDCAACGQASCRQFARTLLHGRTEPDQCVQLPKNAIPRLAETLKQHRETGTNGGRPTDFMELLSDHRQWCSSADRQTFQKVLSARTQKARRLLLNRLEQIWQNLSPKPHIFKRPDPETIYQGLCQYMGHEAVERLRDEEKAYLAEHGEERLKAEWHLLTENQNWLSRANRKRQSRPLLQRQDPGWLAADAYNKVFFLRQLSRTDREAILRFRLDRYQDGFSHWWNEDLLAMNLPDFFIRDWEDFSKIIKNAYWHQESSLSAAHVCSLLKSEALFADNSAKLRNALLQHWLDRESSLVDQRRERLAQVRDVPAEKPIENVDDLRNLIRALMDESKLSGPPATEKAAVSGSVSADDRLLLQNERIWRQFQSEQFHFDIEFSCHSEQLSKAEQKALEGQSTGRKDALPFQASAGPAWYLTSWNEPLQKRIDLIRAMIAAENEIRRKEELECQWLERMLDAGRSAQKEGFEVPASTIRLLIRRALRDGRKREQVESELHDHLMSNSDLQNRLIEDSLYRFVLTRQCNALRRANQIPQLLQREESNVQAGSPALLGAFAGSANESLPSEEETALVKAFPELRSFIDLLLERHKTMDRERLLHYLFLLAKMEGNLDSLTALLREIRETSDIMEAAWLRFTEERIQEGPGPKSLPGTALGIPLLVSRLKDKEAVNHGLAEGVSRKEKRNIAAAVNELINFMRFHVLLNMEHDGNLQSVTKDFINAGYDLSGIDEDVLELAIKRQWDRKEQLLDQRIWIYTTVTARRLAAQDYELQDAERDFYKIRSDILKKDASTNDQYHEIASRRGVALGRIKEEMYRQLSDLLEAERIATFQKRINQIVDQLDKKREEIHAGWLKGTINRRTIFYLLREYQKNERDPDWNDFQRFLRDHWFHPLAELRESQRPDRDERVQEMDNRLKALVGSSLLELEAEAEKEAEQDLQDWLTEQIRNLESRLS